MKGKASPCCFHHTARDIRCVVHGDDFTFAGSQAALEWVSRQMEKVFLCKVEGIMGGDKGNLQQARILNRVLTWNEWGWE